MRRMGKAEKGFTLVEVVIVLSAIGILSAILIPLIEKIVNSSKITKAQNECMIIASAMAVFYKDLGRWPNTEGSEAELKPDLYIPYSPGSCGTASSSIYKAWWKDYSSKPDAFENHLIKNSPGGQSINVYPEEGERAWKGPYLSEIKPDPWGHHYSCNVRYTYFRGSEGREYAVFVWSAGPNGNADIPFYQNRFSLRTRLRGDDIGVRIR